MNRPRPNRQGRPLRRSCGSRHQEGGACQTRRRGCSRRCPIRARASAESWLSSCLRPPSGWLLGKVAGRGLGPNRANEKLVERGPLLRAQRAEQVVINTALPIVGVAELLLASGRELDDMTAAVTRIAASRDEPALLEFVEESDHVARIQTERVRESLLARRAPFAEQIERNQMTRPEAARLERGLEGASTDAREVFDEGGEALVCRRLDSGFGHWLIVHHAPMIGLSAMVCGMPVMWRSDLRRAVV